jgi:HK97 gp10 family phage protein
MIEWLGLDAFKAALDRTIASASAEARAAVSEAASSLEADAKRRAPVQTGTLRRGIRTAPITPWGVGGWQTTVGPTVVYSRRVELGLHGTDSLGRTYDELGHPYFEPAFAELRPKLAGIFAKHWRKAIASA